MLSPDDVRRSVNCTGSTYAYAEVVAQVSLQLREGTPEQQQRALLFINDLVALRRIYTVGETPNEFSA